YEIAWNNIGNAMNKMGRHEPSLKYHDKSLEIKPDFDYALYVKGHALDSLGRHEEGLELISQSLELNPNYDHAWMAKAEALHHLGPLEEARDALNNTLRLTGARETRRILAVGWRLAAHCSPTAGRRMRRSRSERLRNSEPLKRKPILHDHCRFSGGPTTPLPPSPESRHRATRCFSFERTFTRASAASKTRSRTVMPRFARTRMAATSCTGGRANSSCARIDRRRPCRRSTPRSG